MISKKQIISDKDFGKIHFVVRRSARNITMRVKKTACMLLLLLTGV